MFGKKTLAAAFCAALISVSAMAQDGGPGGGGFHHGGGMGRGGLGFLHGVTLTDAQQAQVHEIAHASFAQLKPAMQQLRALHGQIADQLSSSGAVNSAQLASLQQQASQLRSQIEAGRLSMAIQVRGILTQQQLEQAAQLHQQLGALHAQERTLMNQAHPQNNTAQ
jgi:Spy/CpxP family protein refolding chaperone